MPVGTKARPQPEVKFNLNNSLDKGIAAWEEEGGAISPTLGLGVNLDERTTSPGTLGRAHQARGERRAQSRCEVIPIDRRTIE